MQNLLGLGDSKKVRSVAGLAGGIGHRRAACGVLVSGALALGLASAEADEDQVIINARGSSRVNEFVRRFTKEAESTLCSEIARTNFDDNRQLRKYILVGSLHCVRLASKSASILVDIISDTKTKPNESCYELDRLFSSSEFHCSHSVVARASEELNISPSFPSHMLIPLDGGIGYSGHTCAALLGGCLAIGSARGGDPGRNGVFSTFRRLVLTLVQGSSAFNRLDLSPANDALQRCSELFKWFESKFKSHLCREITQVDFLDLRGTGDFFKKEGIMKCASMAEDVAVKAAELAR